MFRIRSERALRALRLSIVAAVAAGALWASGHARAQDGPTCEVSGISDPYEPDRMVINRATPMGRLKQATEPGPGVTSLLICRGGPLNSVIEVEFRFLGPNLRADPFGNAGVMIDTPIPGIGLQVEAASAIGFDTPVPITTVAGRSHELVRDAPLVRVALRVGAYPARTGTLDLSTGYHLHDIPVLELRWRAKGTTAWQSKTSRVRALGETSLWNVVSESCRITLDPSVQAYGPPMLQNHTLRTATPADFTGVGSELLGLWGLDTHFYLTCRNFVGGTLRIDSPTRHPTQPDLIENGYVGADAAKGVAIRLRDSDQASASWDLSKTLPIPAAELSSKGFHYRAYWTQTEPVITPGRFEATVNITIEYD